MSDGSGGVVSTAKDIVVNVTAVNDAPVLTVNSTLTVNEQTSTTLTPAATVSDVDSQNFNTGVLTVTGLDAKDVISIATGTTNTSGAIRLNGTAVELGNGTSWSAIGTLSGGAGASLRITFNSTSVSAAVAQSVVRALTYINNADNPVASHTLALTLSDDLGAQSTTQDILVNLTAVNDAPLPSTATTMSMSLPNSTSVAINGTNTPAVGAGFLLDIFFQGGTISDPDATSTSNLGVAITGVLGKLNVLWYTADGGTTWGKIASASNTSALLLANTPLTRVYFEMSNSAVVNTAYTSLTFRAWDKASGTAGSTANLTTSPLSGATGAGDVSLNLTLLATGVTSPVNILPSYSATEDTAISLYASSSSKIAISDADHQSSGTEIYTITLSVGSGNGALTATSTGGVTVSGSTTNSLTLSGTLENLNAYLASASTAPTYLGATNANGSVTLSMLTKDATGLTASSNSTITISAVNDKPVADLNGPISGLDNIVTFTENSGGVNIAPSATLVDIDSSTLKSMTVTLTTRPNGNAYESLSLTASAQSAATAAGLTVSYDPSTGILSIVHASSTAAIATFQTILNGIVYNNTSNTPDTTARTITVVANDGTLNSDSQSVRVNMTSVNNPPVVATPLVDQAVSVGLPFSYAFASGSFTDPEGGTLTYTATLSDGTPLPGWLSFNATTRTFYGVSPTAGAISVRVIATDPNGASTPSEFAINTTAATSYVAVTFPKVYSLVWPTYGSDGNPVTTDAYTGYYGIETNSFTTDSASIVGTNFTFYQSTTAGEFSGNNVPGYLTYIDAAGQVVKISGYTTRPVKAGGTVEGVYFVTDSDGVNSTYGGNTAYVLVINENYFSSSGTYNSSSDKIDATLNAYYLSPVFDISGGSALEGNVTGNAITFTVTRSSSTGAASVQWATSIGASDTASINDFVGASGTVNFADGETSKTVTITTRADTVYEGNETFTVTLSNPSSGARIGTATATGTIINDDSSAIFSIANSGAVEGGLIAFTVTRTGDAAMAQTVDYTTTIRGSDTASSDDFIFKQGSLTFAAGETSKTITVQTTQDAVLEEDETFAVVLSNATGGAVVSTTNGTATGTIENDEGIVIYSVADVSVSEATGQITFTVVRSGDVSAAQSISYATAGGTAVSGVDFTSSSGTLNFTQGVNSLSFNISINNDTLYESSESFTVSLSNLTVVANTKISTYQATATGTITDNESAPVFSIASASGTEGGNLVFTVTRTGDAQSSQTVSYSTSFGSTDTASSADITSGSGTLTFSQGEISKTFSVPLTVDALVEGSETVTVSLSAPTAGSTISGGYGSAIGTINDPDDARTVSEGGTDSFNIFTNDVVTSPVVSSINGTAWLSLASSTDATSTAALGYRQVVTTNGMLYVKSDGTVSYRHNSSETTSDSFTYIGADGSGNLVTAATVRYAVSAANDAPVNTVVGAQTVNEDINLSIAGLSVADSDAAGGTISVTLSVGHGTITVATNVASGLTLSGVATNSTGSVTLTGTLAEINATLASSDGVVYRGASNFNGSDLLTMTTSDGGNTGTGGALTDIDTVAITVTAVNDAPVNTVPVSQSVNEDANLAITGLSVSDVDAASGTITVTLSVTHGTITVASNISSGLTASNITNNQTGSVVLTGTLSAINATLAGLNGVVYRGDLNFNGSDTLTVTTSDGGNDGSGGALTDVDTVVITVDPVNDAPVNNVPTLTQSSLLNTSITFSSANNNLISVSDVDATSLKVTLQVSHGSLTLSGITGLTFSAGDGTADALMTFTGLSSDINAALSGLVYQPGVSYAGLDTLSITTDDLGATGSGGVKTDVDTVSISVGVVNQAPTGTDKTITTNEDVGYVFGASDFGFSDSDGNTLFAVKIATLPSVGTLTLNGVTVTTSSFIAAADITAGKLVFTPAANANGSGYASFTFQVQDDGGTANGGADLDPVAKTLTVNVTAVNDAPVLTAGGTLGSIEEDASSINGAALSTLGILANDTLDSGSVVGYAIISNAANATTEGTWQYSTNSGVNWYAIGTVTDGSSALALSSSTLVRFVPVANYSGTPGSLTIRALDNSYGATFSTAGATQTRVTVDTTTNGGSTSISSASAIVTTSVTSVNDTPILVSGTRTRIDVYEDSAKSTAKTLGLTYLVYGPGGGADESGQTLTFMITKIPSYVTLYQSDGITQVITGMTLTESELVGLKYKTVPNAYGMGTIAWTVTDNGTTNGVSDPKTFNETLILNVSSINDAPSGTSTTISTLEDTAYTFATSDFGFSDVNDNPANLLSAVRITTLPSVGTLKLYGVSITEYTLIAVTHIAAGKLVFTPEANANGSGYASFTFQVQDNGGTANGGMNLDRAPKTLTLDVTPVNDAPVLTADGTLGSIEEDASSINGAALSTLGILANDTLDSGSVVGYAIVGNAANAATEGAWQYSTDSGVNWYAIDTVTDGSSALALSSSTLVRFVPVANYNGTPGSLTIRALDNSYGATFSTTGATQTRVTVDTTTNGGSTSISSATAIVTTNVTSVNDTPTRTAGTLTAINVNEDGANSTAQSLGLTGLAYGPGGGTDESGQTLTYTITSIPSFITLYKVDGTTAVTATTVLTSAELAGLTYKTVANANGTGSITWTVVDNGTTNGGADPKTLTESLSVSVSSANDAPSGTSTTVTTLEDTAYTFTTADFGFSDTADSPANLLYAVKITTTPSVGTLELNGIAVTAGDLITAADIMAGKLVFTPAVNANGSGYARFTFQVQDDGGTANGGADLDPVAKTLTVDVTAVNDAPIASGSASLTAIAEDATGPAGASVSTLFGGGSNFSDSTDAVTGGSSANAFAGIAISSYTADSSKGVWEYQVGGSGSWTALGSITTTTAITLNASDMLRFVPAANYSGSATSLSANLIEAGLTLTSGGTLDLTSATGGSTHISSGTVTLTQTVTAINDAPSGTSTTVTTLEDTAYTFTTADFGFSDVSDSPANLLYAVKITTTPSVGTLELNGASVTAGDLITAADIMAGKLVFTPVANANGSGYARFTFQVQDDGGTANGGADLDPVAKTLTVDVTAVNDAPIASGSASLTAIAEDTTGPAGASVSTLFGSGSNFSDSTDAVTGGSSANAFAGIAISSYTADSSKGVWEYQVGGSGSWTALGSSTTTTAITLNASDMLRFVPAANYSGSATSLSANLIEAGLTLTSGGTLDLTSATGGSTHISSGTVTLTQTVTAVNDAPTRTTGTLTAINVNEGSANSTAQSLGLTGLAYGPGGGTDESGQTLTYTITSIPSFMTLYKADGTQVTTSTSGLTATDIAGLTYKTVANANGTGSITWTVVDNGTTNGGADPKTLTESLSVSVSSVNDAPSGTSTTVTTLEDTAYTFTTADFGFSDTADSPANLLYAVKITTTPSVGTLELNGIAVTAGDLITAADIVAGKLVFTPAVNANGSGYARFTFQVQDDGGTANGGADLDPVTKTLTVDVTAVNDAPTGNSKTVTTMQNQAYTFAVSDFGFTDSADSVAPNSLLALKISTLPSAGSLTLNGTAVTAGTFISATDIQAGKLVFTPATNANGAGYASFTFQVQDNGGIANSGINLDPAAKTITLDVTQIPTLSVSSVSVSELSPYANFTVSLSTASTSNIQFTPTLVNGTATVGIDTASTLQYFDGANWVTASTFTIAAGSRSLSMRLAIYQDPDAGTIPETLTIKTGSVTGVVNTSGAEGIITISEPVLMTDPVITDVLEGANDPTPFDLLTSQTLQVVKVTGQSHADVVDVFLKNNDGTYTQISHSNYATSEDPSNPGHYTINFGANVLSAGDYVVRTALSSQNSQYSNTFTIDSTPGLYDITGLRQNATVGATQVTQGGVGGMDQNRNPTYWNGTNWLDADGQIISFSFITSTMNPTSSSETKTLASGSTLTLDTRTGTYSYTPASSAVEDVFVIYATDGHKGATLSLTFNAKDTLDRDGISSTVESTLANLVSGGTAGDLNGDGIADQNQNAVTTLAWTTVDQFQAALDGTLNTTKPVISVVVMQSSEGSTVDASSQLTDLKVLSPTDTTIGGSKPTNANWDALQFSIEPLQSMGLLDADTSRAGTQVRVDIDISRSGIKTGEFTKYMKYVSATAIADYAALGVTLTDLDGQNITQAGWYDFTQRTAGGDGARFIVSGGLITMIELIVTDNKFGDNNAMVGKIYDPGVPVYTASSQSGGNSSSTANDNVQAANATAPVVSGTSVPVETTVSETIPIVSETIPQVGNELASISSRPVNPVLSMTDLILISDKPFDSDLDELLRKDKPLVTAYAGKEQYVKVTSVAAPPPIRLADAISPKAPGDYSTDTQAQRNDNSIGLKNTLTPPDALASPAGKVEYLLPQGTFMGGQGSINMIATMKDGSPLPAWISFDGATGKVTATVPSSVTQPIEIKIQANDTKGDKAETHLKINPSPDKRGFIGKKSLTAQIEQSIRLRA